MKPTRMLKVLSFFLIMSVLLSGCQSPFWANRFPGDQANSVWSTKDKNVVFHVGTDEMDPIYGHIQVPDGSVEIGISMSSLVTIVEFYYAEDIRNWDNNNPPQNFAYGHGKVINKKEYQIEITSADAFFESGQVLSFYRQEVKSDQ